MKLQLRFKYSLFCIVLFLLMSTSGQAQRGYTMNFLSQVPHQAKFNPAYYTCYSSYANLPLLSAFQAQLNNDAFSIQRTFTQRVDTTLIDVSKIISNLSSENNLGMDLGVDVLGFGFKIGRKNQIHIGLSVEGYANLLLSKNTFNFLLRGPGFYIDKNADEALSGNSVDLSIYGALSLAYSRIVNEKLSVGGRIKFISGLANLYTENSDISLSIDNGNDPEVTPFTYTLKPNLALKGSFANCPQDSNLFYAVRNISSSIGLPSSIKDNFGMGFDFGATYQVNEAVSVAASIYDIGYVNWNTGVKKVVSQGQETPFVFKGVGRLNDILKDKDFNFKSVMAAVVDSLEDYLQLKHVDSAFTAYRSKLRTSYNISGFYNFTDDDQLGIMWNAQFGRKNRALTIAYTRMFGPNFSICINNAIVNENAINFGGGFALNLGALQFHAIVDKISSFRVINMRAVNVQFGLTLVFNRVEKDPNKQRFVKDYTPRDKTGYTKDRWAQ